MQSVKNKHFSQELMMRRNAFKYILGSSDRFRSKHDKKKKNDAVKDDSVDTTLSSPQPFVSTHPIN